MEDKTKEHGCELRLRIKGCISKSFDCSTQVEWKQEGNLIFFDTLS